MCIRDRLHPDWNALTNDQVRTNIISGASAMCQGSFSGIMSTYNGLLTADGQGEALACIAPLTGPQGDQAWQGHHTSIDVSYGCLLYTSRCV